MRVCWWLLVTVHLVCCTPDRPEENDDTGPIPDHGEHRLSDDYVDEAKAPSQQDQRDKKQMKFHSWGGKRFEDEQDEESSDQDHPNGEISKMNFSNFDDAGEDSFQEAVKRVNKAPAFSSWAGKRDPEEVNEAVKRSNLYRSNNEAFATSKGELGMKRYPSFNSWAGKRAAAFNSWGGKRGGAAFNSWGGKRAAAFNSWGGKRKGTAFNSWGGKRAAAFNSWGGKRGGAAFNSWGGKRGGAAFNSWGGKRAAAFNSWGGKREGAAFNSWGGKRDDSDAEENTDLPYDSNKVGYGNEEDLHEHENPQWFEYEDFSLNNSPQDDGSKFETEKRAAAFNSWGGKRAAAFNSWGGKRAAAFNSWGGKRAAAFNSWGGKRAAAFNSWGGKRPFSDDSEITKNVYEPNLVPNFQSAMLIGYEYNNPSPGNSLNEHAIPSVDGNLKGVKDLKPEHFINFSKSFYSEPNSDLDKYAESVINNVDSKPDSSNLKKALDKNISDEDQWDDNEIKDKRGKPTFSSWAGKRSPLFSSWYGNKIPTVLLSSGKRRPAFSSWGGKRSAPATETPEDCSLVEILKYGTKCRGEHETQPISPSSEDAKIYERKKRNIDCDDEYAIRRGGCINKRGMENVKKNKIITRMYLQGGLSWPLTFKSFPRTMDFYAWGGKRSL